MKILIVLVLLTVTFSEAEATSIPKKCNDGWFAFGRKCYKYIAEAKPWAEAEQFCQSLGGNLASIHSQQTQLVLKQMGKILGNYQRTWIGAQDATQESLWLWSDGSVFDFSLWSSGEPNNADGIEHCVEMNYGDQVLWNDGSCDTKLYFLCQKAEITPTCRR